MDDNNHSGVQMHVLYTVYSSSRKWNKGSLADHCNINSTES